MAVVSKLIIAAHIQADQTIVNRKCCYNLIVVLISGQGPITLLKNRVWVSDRWVAITHPCIYFIHHEVRVWNSWILLLMQIKLFIKPWFTLPWRHNDHDSVSKSPASRLFTQPFIQTQIKENIKAPRHWPLCGEVTGTGEFPAQRATYAENVSIWWRHHELTRVFSRDCSAIGPCLIWKCK